MTKGITIEVIKTQMVDGKLTPILMRITVVNRFGGTVTRQVNGGWPEALKIASNDAKIKQ